MHIEEYIAARVKELCEKYHVSKYRLAQLTGMSQTAVEYTYDTNAGKDM